MGTPNEQISVDETSQTENAESGNAVAGDMKSHDKTQETQAFGQNSSVVPGDTTRAVQTSQVVSASGDSVGDSENLGVSPEIDGARATQVSQRTGENEAGSQVQIAGNGAEIIVLDKSLIENMREIVSRLRSDLSEIVKKDFEAEEDDIVHNEKNVEAMTELLRARDQIDAFMEFLQEKGEYFLHTVELYRGQIQDLKRSMQEFTETVQSNIAWASHIESYKEVAHQISESLSLCLPLVEFLRQKSSDEMPDSVKNFYRDILRVGVLGPDLSFSTIQVLASDPHNGEENIKQLTSDFILFGTILARISDYIQLYAHDDERCDEAMELMSSIYKQVINTVLSQDESSNMTSSIDSYLQSYFESVSYLAQFLSQSGANQSDIAERVYRMLIENMGYLNEKSAQSMPFSSEVDYDKQASFIRLAQVFTASRDLLSSNNIADEFLLFIENTVDEDVYEKYRLEVYPEKHPDLLEASIEELLHEQSLGFEDQIEQDEQDELAADFQTHVNNLSRIISHLHGMVDNFDENSLPALKSLHNLLKISQSALQELNEKTTLNFSHIRAQLAIVTQIHEKTLQMHGARVSNENNRVARDYRLTTNVIESAQDFLTPLKSFLEDAITRFQDPNMAIEPSILINALGGCLSVDLKCIEEDATLSNSEPDESIFEKYKIICDLAIDEDHFINIIDQGEMSRISVQDFIFLNESLLLQVIYILSESLNRKDSNNKVFFEVNDGDIRKLCRMAIESYILAITSNDDSFENVRSYFQHLIGEKGEFYTMMKDVFGEITQRAEQSSDSVKQIESVIQTGDMLMGKVSMSPEEDAFLCSLLRLYSKIPESAIENHDVYTMLIKKIGQPVTLITIGQNEDFAPVIRSAAFKEMVYRAMNIDNLQTILKIADHQTSRRTRESMENQSSLIEGYLTLLRYIPCGDLLSQARNILQKKSFGKRFENFISERGQTIDAIYHFAPSLDEFVDGIINDSGEGFLSTKFKKTIDVTQREGNLGLPQVFEAMKNICQNPHDLYLLTGLKESWEIGPRNPFYNLMQIHNENIGDIEPILQNLSESFPIMAEREPYYFQMKKGEFLYDERAPSYIESFIEALHGQADPQVCAQSVLQFLSIGSIGLSKLEKLALYVADLEIYECISLGTDCDDSHYVQAFVNIIQDTPATEELIEFLENDENIQEIESSYSGIIQDLLHEKQQQYISDNNDQKSKIVKTQHAILRSLVSKNAGNQDLENFFQSCMNEEFSIIVSALQGGEFSIAQKRKMLDEFVSQFPEETHNKLSMFLMSFFDLSKNINNTIEQMSQALERLKLSFDVS